MVDVGVVIEGQDGLTWSRWKQIATLVEDLGFTSLFRSDHFVNPDGPYKETLELWLSLGWLADHTDTLRFGPLVTPMSFRHPVHTARMAKDVDNLSGGRLDLGVGAGWQVREHEMFGFELLDIPGRFDRFEEGVTVIDLLLRNREPVSFEGNYYQLEDATLGPPTSGENSVPLIIGGNGKNRTLPIAAEYAAEWNNVHITPSEFEELTESLDQYLHEKSRSVNDVRRSVMTRVLFGRDDTEVEQLLNGRDKDELRAEGWIIGTAPEVAEQIEAYESAGADRILLQWLELDHEDRLKEFADVVSKLD